MDRNIFLIIAVFFTLGYVICQINKYKKNKSNKDTLINVLVYFLFFILICVLTLLKIITAEYCIYGIILINLVSNFIEYKIKTH